MKQIIYIYIYIKNKALQTNIEHTRVNKRQDKEEIERVQESLLCLNY